MSRKEQDKKESPEEDFFGDLDWLDDDSEVVVRGAESAKVVPPPPPPLFAAPMGSGSVVPRDQKEAEWAKRTAPDPVKLSQAKTLVFSQMPTLPPIDPSELDEILGTDEEPTLEVQKNPPASDISDYDDSVVAPQQPPEVRLDSDLDISAPYSIGLYDDDISLDEGILEEDTSEVPMVRTYGVRREVSAEPPSTPDPPPPRTAPSRPTLTADVNPPDVWKRAIVTLQAESSVASPADRGEYLFRAGWIYQHIIDDPRNAEELYKSAIQVECTNPLVWRELADLWSEQLRWSEAAHALLRYAQRLNGMAAAETYREAAENWIDQLQRPGDGIDALRKALEAKPDDLAALRLLSDLLPDVDPERVAVLEQSAKLSSGAMASDAYYRAGLLVEEHNPNAAKGHYHHAVEHTPGDPTLFAAYERILRDTSDKLGLAEHYTIRAKSIQSEAWWWRQAGRYQFRAENTPAGLDAYAHAQDLECRWVLRDLQGELFRNELWDEFATSIQDEVETGSESASGSALLWFLLGWIHERHTENLESAAASYRRAIELDPSAEPAEHGLRRVLRQREGEEGLKGFLLAGLEAADDAARKSWLFRLAEHAENSSDHASAAQWYRKVLEEDPLSTFAMAGLTRSLRAEEDWSGLKIAYQARADAASAPDLKAHFLYCAASARPVPTADQERSIALYLQALTHLPNHLPSLEVVERALEDSSRHDELAHLMRVAAGATTDLELRLILLYRAAKLWSCKAAEPDKAAECLKECLEIDPSFLPARWLQLEGASATSSASLEEYYRGQSSEWSALAAAVVGGLTSSTSMEILNSLRNRRADAEILWQIGTFATHSVQGISELMRPALVGTDDSAAWQDALRLAEAQLDAGRTEDATTTLDGLRGRHRAGAPIQAAICLASRARADGVVKMLLLGADRTDLGVELCSVLATVPETYEAAADNLRSMLSDHTTRDVAAPIAVLVGESNDDRALLIDGHTALATGDAPPPMRFAHAMVGAGLLEDEERIEAATALYRIASELEPESFEAKHGLMRCFVNAGSTQEIKELGSSEGMDRIWVASLLDQMGETDGSLALLQEEATTTPYLPGILWLQPVLERQEQWQDAYDNLSRRLEISRDEEQRTEIARQQRWILAEKLAHTEEAWRVFQALHATDPDDRQVTEALARIAGQRGETTLAIQYLDRLAEGAAGAEEASRYKRRVAEAQISAGNRAAARQAFLDALDYTPADPEVLSGLKTLAREDEDWPGLLQILRRELSLVDGPQQLAIRREIARISEEELKNVDVAIDAWRSVVEADPSDRDALNRLQKLAESAEQWSLFVEIGETLIPQADGVDRATLLRKMGEMCADHLKREDDAIRFFEEAASSKTSDPIAAARLEQLFRKKNDWVGVGRALDVLSSTTSPVETRVGALIRSAQLELDTRHDREAAAVYYQRVLALDSTNDIALRFMATHLYEVGRLDEALPVFKALEPAVEQEQDLEDFDVRMELSQFYFYFGEMLRLTHDEDGAKTRYARALKLNPTHLASLEAVGPIYFRSQEWRQAEQVYRQLLQLSGGHGERHKVAGTYTQLGLVERALGNTDKAHKRFNKALEIYPNHVGALKGRALLLEDREDWGNLLNIYNNIIYHATVAEDVVQAYMTKGRVLDDHMSRPDKAAQHYQRSLDFKPDQPFALLRLGEIEMRKDNYRRAGELAERGIQIGNEDTLQVHQLLTLMVAAARQDAGKTADAKALLEIIRGSEVGSSLSDRALEDLEGCRQFIHDRLPR